MIGAQVVHKKYGEGKILEADATHIKVKFSGCEIPKKFVYPDAFQKFLRFEDAALEEMVICDVKRKAAQLKAEEEKKLIEFKRLEEERKKEQMERMRKKRKADKARREKELRELQKREQIRAKVEQELG